MTARCAELEWQGMEQMALGLFCETIALLIQRRKRHKPNSSGISMHVYFTLDTAQIMTDLTSSGTDTHRNASLGFLPHATTVTHLQSLQDDRNNLASPEQTSDITSMMHTFISIILFLN